jgi:hypothetical protein
MKAQQLQAQFIRKRELEQQKIQQTESEFRNSVNLKSKI